MFRSSLKSDRVEAELLAVIPAAFKDPLLDDLLQEKQLAVSPAGICFNDRTLESHWKSERKVQKMTCPLTRRPLDHPSLVQGPLTEELKNICKEANDEFKKTLEAVTQKKQKLDDAKKSLSEFAASKAIKFNAILEKIKKIDALKERAKLNARSPEHVQFWDQQCSTFKKLYLRFKSKKLLDLADLEISKGADGQDFLIPKSVAKLMEDGNTTFTSDQAFIEKMNAALEANRNSRHKLFCCMAPRALQKLLHADNIEDIDLRKTF